MERERRYSAKTLLLSIITVFLVTALALNVTDATLVSIIINYGWLGVATGTGAILGFCIGVATVLITQLLMKEN